MSLEVPAIRTERLVLEPQQVRHVPALLDYFKRNRTHLEPWEPTRPAQFFTEAYQLAEIQRACDDCERGTGIRFLAFEPGDDRIVASLNLSNIRRGVIHSAIVSYAVDATRARRGYATELVRAIVRYAFDTLALHRIEASYQPENRASGRVLAKNGFIVEGYARDYLFLNGAWRDGVLVSLTNDAWVPAQAP
jgi:ribosomal-protein-alanine N-acetyltransferase